MERFRAGIIGCGRVASLLEDDPLEQKPCTHAGAYSQVGEVALVAAADLDEQRLAAFGRRWGVRALYSDYRRMLAEERLEIVSLCAYAPSRCQMVLDAVEAGVKGIWCEKALEDVGGYGTVGFDDGVIATVHGRGKGYFFFELDLVGSEGRIRIGNNDLLELWTRGESRHYTGFLELHRRRFPLGHPLENAWVAAVRELISCIQEGRESSSNGHDGRAALEMALAFHQSHLRGGARVDLPLASSELRICSR